MINCAVGMNNKNMPRAALTGARLGIGVPMCALKSMKR